MLPVIEAKHLQLVAAISETGSMRRAAERLHVSQPALSRQLSAIEATLETPLFHRAPRMRLTVAGEELLARARALLPQLIAAEDRIRELGRGNTGTVRLSTECNTCYQWLPSRLSQLQRKFPQVFVQLILEATPNPLPWLQESRLDLAIVSSEPRLRGIALTPLFTDELVAIAAPAHPWARKRFVEPRDFSAEHLYVYNMPLEANMIYRRVLGPASVRPRHVSHLPLTEATVSMVKAGLGVAVLARWAVAEAVREGSLVACKVTAKGLIRRWAAARRDTSPVPRYLAAFIELLAAAPFHSTAA